jgi:MacB-like periplasmic core domain
MPIRLCTQAEIGCIANVTLCLLKSLVDRYAVLCPCSVCVLAAGTANQLFPTENPLGKAIRIREIPYNVVGVMKPRTPMAGIGSSLAA